MNKKLPSFSVQHIYSLYFTNISVRCIKPLRIISSSLSHSNSLRASMADADVGSSSSSSKDIDDSLCCFHCQSKTTTSINGWLLCTGDFAVLCHTCGTHYENGTFCKTFHTKFDGWRDCVVCNRMLHCGCIMSNKDIFLLDFGGVCCMDCANKVLLQG